MPRWEPILAGDDQAAALDIVDVIAAALADVSTEPSLGAGHAGIAVFFAYRALGGGGEADAALAAMHLERALDAIARHTLTGDLLGGISGITWAAHHLASLGICEPIDSDDVDAVLLEHVATIDPQDYGLGRGLVGLGVAALDRIGEPFGADCVRAVIARLAELAERDANGACAWFTPPSYLAPIPLVLEKAPDGCYQPGVAHGIAGVAGFLARATAALADPVARELLAGSVRWLLAHTLPETMTATFSRWVYPGAHPKASRHSWCTGDLGIAGALALAADATGDAALAGRVLAIAHKAAARPEERSAYINDAGFCHGAAGLVHQFARFHARYRDPRFADETRRWVDRVVAMRDGGSGIAGFTAKLSLQWDVPLVARAEPGLLSGAAGIGLALLAAATPVEPAWDRILLASAPS